MLRAITLSGHMLILTIDDAEVRDLDLPDGILTDDELGQIRTVRPGAMPGYVPRKEEVTEEVVEDWDV